MTDVSQASKQSSPSTGGEGFDVAKLLLEGRAFFALIVIIVVSLSRDFLPSAWGFYWGTIWDWATYLGTIGLFFFLFFLFIRSLPMISIFEVRTLLPEAEVTEGVE